jgi:hypothetical protein
VAASSTFGTKSKLTRPRRTNPAVGPASIVAVASRASPPSTSPPPVSVVVASVKPPSLVASADDPRSAGAAASAPARGRGSLLQAPTPNKDAEKKRAQAPRRPGFTASAVTLGPGSRRRLVARVGTPARAATLVRAVRSDIKATITFDAPSMWRAA